MHNGCATAVGRTDTKSHVSFLTRTVFVSTFTAPLSRGISRVHMTFANFTKLSQELRDQIWAEAAAIQCQQVRTSFSESRSLSLLTLNCMLIITQLVDQKLQLLF